MKQFGGRIADAHNLELGELAQSLSNESGGIREVDEPSLGCKPLHHSCMFQGHRNGAQGHRNAPGPGGFLTCKAFLDGNTFVSRASRHATNAQTAEHKVAPFHRRFN